MIRSQNCAQKSTLARWIIGLIALSSVNSCATPDGKPTLQRRQVTECPDGMILICESDNPPSSGGDEEIPGYERCYCRSRF